MFGMTTLSNEELNKRLSVRFVTDDPAFWHRVGLPRPDRVARQRHIDGVIKNATAKFQTTDWREGIKYFSAVE